MSDVVIESLPFKVDALKAYYALSSGSGSILLEGMGMKRWDVILTDPIRTLKGNSLTGKVVHELERVRDKYPYMKDIPFTGGIAGFLSYETCAANAWRIKPQHQGLTPGFWFGVYDRGVVIDHEAGRTYAIINQKMGAGGRTEARRMLQRITRMNELPHTEHLSVTPVQEFSRTEFESAVKRAKEFIRAGDIYQVNIAHRILLDGRVDPLALYANLRRINPSPHMGYGDFGDLRIVCNSPERLLYICGEKCETRPIAGTRPRGRTHQEDKMMLIELTSDEKEIAEHTMMVDMERNDLGRISLPGSVYVNEMMSVEKYSHVMHLVSNIRGRIAPEVSISDILSAMMPGGTISGVPKSRAMEIIDMLEPVERGPYTGSMGYISSHMDMNILIRTLIFTEGRGYLYVGSGIVHDSIPEREFDETIYKANAALSILSESHDPAGSCSVITTGSWTPPVSKKQFNHAKVLLIDSYDSFTYNLAQYVSSTGAKVDTVLRDDIPSNLRGYTHIIISPGPGRPEDAKECIDLIQEEKHIPILGVCLGHQAIGVAFGGEIEMSEPVHGKTSYVKILRRSPIFSGLPERFEAGRYHSLVVSPSSLPRELTLDAVSDEGIVMAISHRKRKVYGIQFHPESVLTPWGLAILENFLAVKP